MASYVAAGTDYGNLPARGGEKIQLEYVSANPYRDRCMVGHGRGAAVGSSLANLLKAAGYDVTREYYINDAGNQINNLAASVNARYLEELGVDVEFPENGLSWLRHCGTAKRIVKIYGDKFLHMDEQERLH